MISLGPVLFFRFTRKQRNSKTCASGYYESWTAGTSSATGSMPALTSLPPEAAVQLLELVCSSRIASEQPRYGLHSTRIGEGVLLRAEVCPYRFSLHRTRHEASAVCRKQGNGRECWDLGREERPTPDASARVEGAEHRTTRPTTMK